MESAEAQTSGGRYTRKTRYSALECPAVQLEIENIRPPNRLEIWHGCHAGTNVGSRCLVGSETAKRKVRYNTYSITYLANRPMPSMLLEGRTVYRDLCNRGCT